MVNEDLFLDHQRVNPYVFTDLQLSLLMLRDVVLVMLLVLGIEVFVMFGNKCFSEILKQQMQIINTTFLLADKVTSY